MSNQLAPGGGRPLRGAAAVGTLALIRRCSAHYSYARNFRETNPFVASVPDLSESQQRRLSHADRRHITAGLPRCPFVRQYRAGSGEFCAVACGDPTRRAQTGSVRLGAKVLPRTD